MFEQLYPCPCCRGVPKIGRSTKEVEDENALKQPRAHPLRLVKTPVVERYACIMCSKCGLSTKWVLVDEANENAAYDECGRLWNTRADRLPVKQKSLEDLIQKEVNIKDIPYILALLARNDGEWEERGPILAQLAQRVLDAKVVTRKWWPINPTLEDASRYRKLMGNSTVERDDEGQGPSRIVFPSVPLSEEFGDDVPYDKIISQAIDALPDRERW
jgi:hypothetical protein